MKNYEKYLNAEQLILDGIDIKQACREVNLPVSNFYYFRKRARQKIIFYEREISYKLLLLYMMLIAGSLILLAFWFEIL